jgi:small subunit ribosomal protein S16
MLAQGNAERVVINTERAKYWVSQGAAPTERVALFLANFDVVEKVKISERPKKSAPKRKAQEREQQRLAIENATAGQ